MAAGRFIEITEPGHASLPAAKELFREVFPEEGEGGWEWVMQGLERARPGTPPRYRLILYSEQVALGLAALAVWSEAEGPGSPYLAYLDYLGVRGAYRDRGLGAALYGRALAKARGDADDDEAALGGMALDVECVEDAPHDDERRLRLRRIAFYERLGARVMPGVLMLEPPEGGEAPVAGCLLYHPVATRRHPRDLLLLLYRLLFGRSAEDPLVRAALDGRRY
ncbi:MAG: GNAT family N-acetyltransferase [Candidatus Geothermincolia bacterium]